jgi:hypothetical protein
MAWAPGALIIWISGLPLRLILWARDTSVPFRALESHSLEKHLAVLLSAFSFNHA